MLLWSDWDLEGANCLVVQGLFTNPERNAFRQPGVKQPMYRVRFRQASKSASNIRPPLLIPMHSPFEDDCTFVRNKSVASYCACAITSTGTAGSQRHMLSTGKMVLWPASQDCQLGYQHLKGVKVSE